MNSAKSTAVDAVTPHAVIPVTLQRHTKPVGGGWVFCASVMSGPVTLEGVGPILSRDFHFSVEGLLETMTPRCYDAVNV